MTNLAVLNQALSLETLTKMQPQSVTLTPVIMRFPNRYCIYSPHPQRACKQLPFAEFQARYGRYATLMRVCFAETNSTQVLYEQSLEVTAFGFGLEGWFVVTGFA
jgi:hypothetical protein